MTTHRHIGFILLFLIAAGGGYFILSTLADQNAAKTDPRAARTYQRRGIVKEINATEGYIVLEATTGYTAESVAPIKLSITNGTEVERASFFLENDVVNYEGTPLPSSLSSLKPGDAVLAIFKIDKDRLIALYLRHGTPLPGI